MSKTIITATEVRNNFFQLIDEVARTGKPIFIKKDKEIKVQLGVVKNDLEAERKKTREILKKTYGMWKHLTEEEIRGNFRRADLAATRRIRSRKW